MSVRRRMDRDPLAGAAYEVWLVDIVFQHPDGREQRIKKKSPVQTRRGAEDYERQVRNALLDGSYGKKEEKFATFGDFAETFVNTYATANNKPSEVRSKNSILNLHMKPAFGRKRLGAIGSEDVEAYKARMLREGLKPKTVHNHLAVLSKLMRMAVEWGYLQTLPTIKTMKLDRPEFDFLTFEEADRLVAAGEGMWGTMTVVALNTGLRIGELRALRWEDVDLVSGRILVRRNVWRDKIGSPKGGRSREVPLNSVARDALKGHRHLRGELIFCRDDGSMQGETEGYKPLGFTCKRAGLRSVAWQVMRHTFASHLVMRGQPLKAVQELLGHASIEMTMRYAHLSPDVRRDAVEALTKQAPARPDDGPARISASESAGTLRS